MLIKRDSTKDARKEDDLNLMVVFDIVLVIIVRNWGIEGYWAIMLLKMCDV